MNFLYFSNKFKYWLYIEKYGFPWWFSSKDSTCSEGDAGGFDPWVRNIPWRKEWQPTPVFLPGEFHGQRNLAGYSLWGCKESDMTERLTHTPFDIIAEDIIINKATHTQTQKCHNF